MPTIETVLKLDKFGWADSKNVVVRGGSAGGYSVLDYHDTSDIVCYGFTPLWARGWGFEDESLHKSEYCLCDRLRGGTLEESEDVWEEVRFIVLSCRYVHFRDSPRKRNNVIPMDRMVEVGR
ncbi:hypothetical protein K435DRAFT_868157 [Dendrothele bispora CBS 962.96]|uniref:Uncharacterized protein n=1 Tax=Dendrothele bispora (strain CBS 962.96) TaxID=1314807 RepID=A0A4S8LCV4_DENBC|nr:hypothetical protein K435DRAFT_874341 [Dendrothele bispora CBS 962.96]THU86541.1 hypothetical protein K435DRAFT_868157 [Dendrothele bispora CBS 962.96]